MNAADTHQLAAPLAGAADGLLFQLSPVAMALKDGDGRLLQVNPAWCRLTGISADRATGRSLGQLYPAQVAAPHEVREQMVLNSGQPARYEDQWLDADGLPRDVVIDVVPLPPGVIDGATPAWSGIPAATRSNTTTTATATTTGLTAASTADKTAAANWRLLVCLQDVSSYREAEVLAHAGRDSAERANAAKAEALAMVSHELRTPLQSVLGFAELGRRRAPEGRLQEMFGDIHQAGERLLAMVNDLLDLARIDSAVGDIQLQPQDIAPALLAVLDELHLLAAERGVTLQPPAAVTPLWAFADAPRLQQVMRNLLANAIRFAPAGSMVHLAWQHQAGQHLISVRDHGPGVPEVELDSIFQPFVQSSRNQRSDGGSGLGLAICRRIANAHHGQISARNHPEGGAVFELVLRSTRPRTT